MVNMEMLEYGAVVAILGMAVVFSVLGINWALIRLIGLFAVEAEKPDKDVASAIAAAVRMYEKDEKLIR